MKDAPVQHIFKAQKIIAPDILAKLKAGKNILILTHHNPDGDALGSAIAFQLALKNQGQKSALHISGTYTDNLNFLMEGATLSDLSDLADYDLILLLDCHSFLRLGAESQKKLSAYFSQKESTPLIVIDHHLLETEEESGSLWHHFTEASSTGELSLEIISALGLVPDSQTARALLTAIATDTGSFSQTNATAHSLKAAAFLVECGASLAEVERLLNRNRPPRRIRLMAAVMASLELHYDGRVAIFLLDQNMLEQSGATLADSDGFVEILRTIAGVDLGALIKITDSPYFKVSMRSQNGISAAALATSLGGGGHQEAASYTDQAAKNIIEAKENFLAAAGKIFL